MKEYIYRVKKVTDEFVTVNADSKEEADALVSKKEYARDIIDGSVVFVEEKEPTYQYEFSVHYSGISQLRIIAHSQEEAKSMIMNMDDTEIDNYAEYSTIEPMYDKRTLVCISEKLI